MSRRVAAPALGTPGLFALANVDRALVIQDVESLVVMFSTRGNRNKVATTPKTLGICVAVLIGHEEIRQRVPESAAVVRPDSTLFRTSFWPSITRISALGMPAEVSLSTARSASPLSSKKAVIVRS